MATQTRTGRPQPLRELCEYDASKLTEWELLYAQRRAQAIRSGLLAVGRYYSPKQAQKMIQRFGFIDDELIPIGVSAADAPAEAVPDLTRDDARVIVWTLNPERFR